MVSFKNQLLCALHLVSFPLVYPVVAFGVECNKFLSDIGTNDPKGRMAAQTKSGVYVFSGNDVKFWPNRSGECLVACNEITDNASHLAILRRQVGEERFNQIVSIINPEQREEAAQQAMLTSSAKLETPEEIKTASSQLRLKISQVSTGAPLSEDLVSQIHKVAEAVGLDATDLKSHFRSQFLKHREKILAGKLFFHAQDSDVTWRSDWLPWKEANTLIERTVNVEIITGDVGLWKKGEPNQSMSMLVGDLSSSMHMITWSYIHNLIEGNTFVTNSNSTALRIPYIGGGRSMDKKRYRDRSAKISKGYIVYQATSKDFTSGTITEYDWVGNVLRTETWNKSDLPPNG